MLLLRPCCERPAERARHLVEVSRYVKVIPCDDRSTAPLDG